MALAEGWEEGMSMEIETQMTFVNTTIEAAQTISSPIDRFGSWMIVNKKARKPVNTPKRKPVVQENQTSSLANSFEAL